MQSIPAPARFVYGKGDADAASPAPLVYAFILAARFSFQSSSAVGCQFWA